jgi:hypothetical protein
VRPADFSAVRPADFSAVRPADFSAVRCADPVERCAERLRHPPSAAQIPKRGTDPQARHRSPSAAQIPKRGTDPQARQLDQGARQGCRLLHVSASALALSAAAECCGMLRNVVQ